MSEVKIDKDFFINLFKLEGATPAGQFNLRGVICLFIMAIIFGMSSPIVECVSIIFLHKTLETYSWWQLISPGLIVFIACFTFLAWQEIQIAKVTCIPAIHQIASATEENLAAENKKETEDNAMVSVIVTPE